ncbi:MAG: GNAT family N-acetyltransferase [Ignavibacteriales bacterium]|nr:GNAT family N-acetyltransferase [Ignavibacteriales bacterium]
MLAIKPVQTRDELNFIHQLFLEYASSLDFKLCFQNFDNELANLPGDYSPPSGRLLIAFYKSNPAGCVALRKHEANVCEMKRLYVKSEFRGKEIGKKLCESLIEESKKIGYEFMRVRYSSKYDCCNKTLSVFRI